LNSTANPPILNVTKISNNLLMIDYFSKRKMGDLAVGIIKGIAKFYTNKIRLLLKPKRIQRMKGFRLRLCSGIEAIDKFKVLENCILMNILFTRL
jgi:hypothetical protein